MIWSSFEAAAPELTQFGRKRFGTGVAFLATTKADGAPRVHPVTPIIGGGRLFLFMEPTSPKGEDLRRDGRFALHSSVEDSGGGGGEFLIEGKAKSVEDPNARQLAAESASYEPSDRYVLFELQILRALSTVYDERGRARRIRWCCESKGFRAS